MTEDEIAYAASQALLELEPDSVVLSVSRLPDKPFGWVVVFDGAAGTRSRVTFDHLAADTPGDLKEKIKAGLAGRAR